MAEHRQQRKTAGITWTIATNTNDNDMQLKRLTSAMYAFPYALARSEWGYY